MIEGAIEKLRRAAIEDAFGNLETLEEEVEVHGLMEEERRTRGTWQDFLTKYGLDLAILASGPPLLPCAVVGVQMRLAALSQP